MGTDQNESTSDKKRIIIPAAVGVGMLLLGLVLGFGIAAMAGAGKSAEMTPVVITQISPGAYSTTFANPHTCKHTRTAGGNRHAHNF